MRSAAAVSQLCAGARGPCMCDGAQRPDPTRVGMPMNWNDLDRPPLSAARLARDLADDGYSIRVVPETASTNADLVSAAGQGAPEGTVLVAEVQQAGRGRLG